MPNTLMDMGLKAATPVLHGAAVGVPSGILAALIARKMDLAIDPTVQSAKIQMADRPAEVAKKRKVKMAFTPTVAHAAGAVGGGLAGYKVLGKLLQRKDQRKLDTDLADRERKFNDLLMHEQALAGGFGKVSAVVLRAKRASDAIHGIEKLAEAAYEKYAAHGIMSTPIKDLLARAAGALRLNESSNLIAIPATLAGAAAGYAKTREADPNVQKAKAVKDSLKERLTGKDNLVGPMPIRVESDTPAMRPLRSGGASLVDPTKGRDVLEGI